MHGQHRRFLVLALLGGAAVLAVGAFLALFAVRGGEPALAGTDLGKRPAPDFALIDQRGQSVRLSDFRGQAVVLTFVYTNCPDVCPAIARTLHTTYELLPAETRDEVALVAVTVDPERDTADALEAFSATHGLAENPNWFALWGDRATLEPVWRAYGIHPEPNRATPGAGGPGHTDAIFLIDPDGRLRVLLRSGVAPQVLADNLKALLV